MGFRLLLNRIRAWVEKRFRMGHVQVGAKKALGCWVWGFGFEISVLGCRVWALVLLPCMGCTIWVTATETRCRKKGVRLGLIPGLACEVSGLDYIQISGRGFGL